MHSTHYEEISRWYALGLWKQGRLRAAVEKHWLTAAEYEEITQKPY